MVGGTACVAAEFIFPRQSVVAGKLFALLLAETRADAQLVAVYGVKIEYIIGNFYAVALVVGVEVFAVNVPRFAVIQLKDFADADVRTAARIAQAEEFISAKPEGYESPIAQGGTNVSGGQKQRLSIARAIAKHPKIYLFDDSFSALDYKTDVALRRALKAETGDATVIIVAQRISTVLHANQILVLEDGRIVGKGTHAQLMESCPAYQEIARSQLSNKELDLKGGEA